MKPKVEKILAKLSQEDKTELKSEKIELSLSSRAEQQTYELQKGIEDFQIKYITSINELISRGSKEKDRLSAVARMANKTLSELKSAYKELGIDMNTKLIRDLDKAITEFNSVMKRANKF